MPTIATLDTTKPQTAEEIAELIYESFGLTKHEAIKAGAAEIKKYAYRIGAEAIKD